MSLVKLITVSLIGVSLAGCVTTESTQKTADNSIVLTQAEMELMIEKAKADERKRIERELKKQAHKKKVFAEMLARQNAAKLAANQSASAKGNLQNPQNKLKKITKIKPKNRQPVIYKTLEGVNYWRCAANAFKPVFDASGKWSYASKTLELSATLCKKSRDVATMTALQYELYERGYLRSTSLTKDQLIDGVWGESTLEAVKKYQTDHGLLLGQLTIETLEHLGVFEPHTNSEDELNKVIAVVKNVVNELEKQSTEQKTAIQKPGNDANALPDDVKSLAKLQQKPQENPQEKAQISSQTAPATEDVDSQAEMNKVTAILHNQLEAQNSKAASNPAIDNTQVFTPIKIQRANASGFDVINGKPISRNAVLFAKLNNKPLWRCRARAQIAQKNANGQFDYLGHKAYRATLCKASRSENIIKQLQIALRDKGFLKPSPPADLVVVDGIWGLNTLKAVKAYQKQHGLAYGQLTIEVLEHLGLFIE